MTELVGQRLGQYQIVEQIAKGAMATVYKATQTSIGRSVAIKVLPASMSHDDKFLERFYREVEIAAGLQHPHILPVYDFGQQDGLPYIVMAYLPGGTLDDVIRLGPMQLKDVTSIVKQLAQALDYAHSKGIVHRDFKPGNVLLDERGNCYLADFGLAKVEEVSSQLTGMTILGTPFYMAPEQGESAEVTSSADIYALAVTIFQMLTGRVPFEATTPLAVMMAHISKPIPQLYDYRPDLPDMLQFVINRGMAKRAEDRYPAAGQLATALEQAAKGLIPDDAQEEVTATPSLAMLMTNMLGQVIFVDTICLKLLKRHSYEVRTVVGKSLHDVLGCSRNVTDQLIKDVAKLKQVVDLPMEIRDSSGNKITVLCTATATHDDKGGFVGADIALKAMVDPSAPTMMMDFTTMDKRLNTMEETNLQTYFKAQLESLQELVVQLGGKRFGANLEKIINDTSQRNVWPVAMQNGHIVLELRNTDGDIYRALLAKAISYAVSVIGPKSVAKQMQQVNQRLDPRVVEFVKQLGLGELFNELL